MIGSMGCPEREHLAEMLRIAAHELSWAIIQESMAVLSGNLSESEHNRSVVTEGVPQYEYALEAYRSHLEQHACPGTGARERAAE
jgi:hypothetical protein